MLPFAITFDKTQPAAEQVVHAVKRAVASGQLRAGDVFPSVRELSKALQVNPKTVQKAVASLVVQGVLRTIPNSGTRVSDVWQVNQQEKLALLQADVRKLVVDARLTGMEWEELVEELFREWNELR